MISRLYLPSRPTVSYLPRLPAALALIPTQSGPLTDPANNSAAKAVLRLSRSSSGCRGLRQQDFLPPAPFSLITLQLPGVPRRTVVPAAGGSGMCAKRLPL